MISEQSLEILKQLAETQDCSIHWNSEYNIALDEVIQKLKELDKDNNDLRRLYRRTAIKLEEKGYEELAGYFLAQINEVPTFVVEDDIDYYEEYHKLKEKLRSYTSNG